MTTTLPPNILPSLRQAFSLLSNPSTQTISPASLTSMLSSLSLPHSPLDLAQFFPASGPRELTFAHFLTALSELGTMGDEKELLGAFEAFEEGDGEVPVNVVEEVCGRECVEALEKEGYVGRRGRERVVKFREWIQGVKGVKEK